MIHLVRRIGPLTYHRAWFARSCSFADRFRLISYRQFLGAAPHGFVRKAFRTLHIDLSLSVDELFADLKKSTAYEVRRAEKEGVVLANLASVETQESFAEVFRTFFNKFAPTKGLSELSESQVISLRPGLSVSAAYLEGVVLVMHAWLIDTKEGRARLLYSATTVDPAIDRAIVGRANRLLHFGDLLTQKAEGLLISDLGGVAFDPEKPETAGIDQFKLSFGGTIVQEDHFDSLPLVCAEIAKNTVRRLRSFVVAKDARNQEKK